MGAEDPDYDLTGWRNVDLPHDWSIEDISGTGSPFDSTSVGSWSTGYTVGGTGWYVKEFILEKIYNGKRSGQFPGFPGRYIFRTGSGGSRWSFLSLYITTSLPGSRVGGEVPSTYACTMTMVPWERLLMTGLKKEGWNL
jgi:hypothetical protein